MPLSRSGYVGCCFVSSYPCPYGGEPPCLRTPVRKPFTGGSLGPEGVAAGANTVEAFVAPEAGPFTW